MAGRRFCLVRYPGVFSTTPYPSPPRLSLGTEAAHAVRHGLGGGDEEGGGECGMRPGHASSLSPASSFRVAFPKDDMGLGNKKGRVSGSQVSGGHTTLIDGADNVIKKLGVLSWFESVGPGMISVAK